MKLTTTDTAFHALEAAANRKHRKNATTVDVPIEALRALIADHVTMVAACKRSIEPGEDQRSLA
jgi:hypothetical protein